MGRYRDYVERLDASFHNKLDAVYGNVTNVRFPVDTNLRLAKDNSAIVQFAKAAALAAGRSDTIDPVVNVELDRRADQFGPDTPIDPALFATPPSCVWKLLLDWDTAVVQHITGRLRPVTVAELRLAEQELAALGGPIPAGATNVPLDRQAKEQLVLAMRASLSRLIRPTADQAQFACYYLRGIALDFQRAPTLPALPARFDQAVSTLDGFFASVSDGLGGFERTPVRYTYPSTLRELVPDSERTKAGFFKSSETLNRVEVRTDLSREGFSRPFMAAAQLHAATADPAQRQTLEATIVDALDRMATQDFEAYEGLKSNVYFSVARQVRQDPRLAMARPLLAFFPHIDQIDGMRGSDKMYAYALLRSAAELGLTSGGVPFSRIADDYFARRGRDMEITTSEFMFRIAGKKLRQVAADALDIFSERAGGLLIEAILFLLFVMLAFVLLAVAFPFLAIFAVLILLLPVVILVILASGPGNTRVYPQFFDTTYDTISLEAELCAFLKQFDDPANSVGQQMWDTKLAHMAVLERDKSDALFQAYFAQSSMARDALVFDFVAGRQQLANLTIAFNQARANVQSNPLSPSAQQAFAQAYGALTTFQQIYDFAARVEYNTTKEVPEKLVRVNYARAYTKDFAFFNTRGTWEDPVVQPPQGSIQTKIDRLNATVFPLTLGVGPLGNVVVGPLANPSRFETARRITDFGDLAKVLFGLDPREPQHATVVGPEYWEHRTSVIAASPYKLTHEGDNIDWASPEWYLAKAYVDRALDAAGRPDIVTTIDQMNP